MIGEGLFAKTEIPTETRLLPFYGDIIQKKTIPNEALGYISNISANKCLNCYTNRMNGTCKASCGNSPIGLADADGKIPTENARIVVNNKTNTVHLVSTKHIYAGDEILYRYGNGFFPKKK